MCDILSLYFAMNVYGCIMSYSTTYIMCLSSHLTIKQTFYSKHGCKVILNWLEYLKYVVTMQKIHSIFYHIGLLCGCMAISISYMHKFILRNLNIIPLRRT